MQQVSTLTLIVSMHGVDNNINIAQLTQTHEIPWLAASSQQPSILAYPCLDLKSWVDKSLNVTSSGPQA